MRTVLQIVDDFLPNPDVVRNTVISQGFKDEKFEDTIYHTVNADYLPSDIPVGLCRLFNKSVNIHVAAFRQGKVGSPIHNVVHADNTCASLASVLYLNPTPAPGSGTAFWKHKVTGWDQQPTEDQLREANLTIEGFCADWHKLEAWEMVTLTGAKYNRLIIYPTVKFHSRWPLDGFGETDESARLVHCAFFDL